MAFTPTPMPYYGQNPSFPSAIGGYTPTVSTPQIAYQNSQPTLNLVPGRMVHDESEISAIDVPMDGVSIFPTSDGSKIFMKRWDGKGGIITTTYVPQSGDTNQSDTQLDSPVSMNDLFDLLNNIDTTVKALAAKPNNNRGYNKQNKNNQNGSSEATHKED